MTVPGSELSAEAKDMLRKCIHALFAGDITSYIPSTDTPQTGVHGPTISITLADALRAQASCLLAAPPINLSTDFMKWCTQLTNTFIAELYKPHISCTATTSPQNDGDDVSYQGVPSCSQPSSSPSFSWRQDENAEEATNPWIPEATIKTEPCEMETGTHLESKEGILDEGDTTNYSTQPEEPLIHDDGDAEMSDDSGISLVFSKDHKIRLTKDVPPTYAYWWRGVICPLCKCRFRGQSCVSEVVEHVQMDHENESSPQLIRKLLQDTTPEKVIGPGIRYCGCQTCIEAAKQRGYPG